VSSGDHALRDRYTAFIERHEIAWELGMGLLALLWVAVGFLDQQVPDAAWAVGDLELVLTLIFLAEFLSRFLAARSRRDYARSHWIDAIALVPVVRGLRLLRLVRLLRVVRAFAGIYRAAMQFERLSRHRGFAALLAIWVTVMVLCSMFVFVAETGTVDSLINNPFDALWWGVSTMTTVGYGDTYPKTPEGRLGAMVLMVLGIGLFSAITATMTSFLARSDPGDPDDLAANLRSLADLHDRGKLSDEEFGVAKARVLADGSAATAARVSLDP
jgi:voltage-gated potassium channel